MKEIWKDIKGYEGRYQVSNLGNVKSLNYNNTGKEQLLKPKKNKYTYNEVKLSKNNKTKSFLIATLVAQAFLGQKNPDMEVMHIGDVTVDSVDNLRYAYRSQILHQMYKKGRRKIGMPTKNKISYNGIKYKKMSDLARHYNLTPHQMFKRLNNGWTLTEALNIPIERKEHRLYKKLYMYNNQLLSIKQLSKLSKISASTIWKRLNRGWDIEETIEIPLGRRKK